VSFFLIFAVFNVKLDIKGNSFFPIKMNKPCIIGAKIATKVLRDGDLVEACPAYERSEFCGVDANKGVVKILKRG